MSAEVERQRTIFESRDAARAIQMSASTSAASSPSVVADLSGLFGAEFATRGSQTRNKLPLELDHVQVEDPASSCPLCVLTDLMYSTDIRTPVAPGAARRASVRRASADEALAVVDPPSGSHERDRFGLLVTALLDELGRGPAGQPYLLSRWRRLRARGSAAGSCRLVSTKTWLQLTPSRETHTPQCRRNPAENARPSQESARSRRPSS